MAEGQLRQIWAGLMPAFPEPATLLAISDPDDRAVTMLLKTLYVVFKGVLDERHQLLCGGPRTECTEPRTNCAGPRTNCAEPWTNSAEPRTSSTRPGAAAADPGSASVEELVPASPGDMVPPSPGNVTHVSQTRRPATVLAPPLRPVVLVPETVDIASPPCVVPRPRPVAETVPAPVWVPETLEASPTRRGPRPCPVPETMLPSTPPRPPRQPRQPEVVSPVLPGRSPASRRARRAASRAGALSSPAPVPTPPPPPQPPQPPTLPPPPPTEPTTTTSAAAAAAAEVRAEVVSPTPSLSSPLLLPQRPPDRVRRPAVAEVTLAESPTGRTGGAARGSARGVSRLSRSKPSQTGANGMSAAAQGGSTAGRARQSPVKKRKYVFIGPDDPVPPRKPRGAAAASPQKHAQQQPPSSLAPHRTPVDPPTSLSAAISVAGNSSRAAASVTHPSKTSAPSIFELGSTSGAAQQCAASNKGHPSNIPVGGKRTPSKRTPSKRTLTPQKSSERRGGSVPAGEAGERDSGSESLVLPMEVLLEELNGDGAATQGGGQGQNPGQGQQNSGQGQPPGDGREGAERRPGGTDGACLKAGGWPKPPGDAPDQEHLHTHGDNGAEPGETTGDLPEHESQEETQMDSLVFGEPQPAAGPSYKYDAGPVRRQADRQKLPGWSCNLCKEWYSDRDMTDEELRTHMNRCSRHRQKDAPPPDTPPGFWDPVGFPSMNVTQYGGDGPRTRTRRKL